MDLLRHVSSLPNMHSNEPSIVVLIHTLLCYYSKLCPLTANSHPQQNWCTNANSEQPCQPRYATATHQPCKSMSRSTHAPNLLRHRLTNAAKHLPPCMLVNQLQHRTPFKRFGFLLLWYASSPKQLSSIHQQWFHILLHMETPPWMQCQSSQHCPKWHHHHTPGSV